MPRPVTREHLISPDVMIGIIHHFPKRTNFAKLAGVTPQVLHRALNREPCNEDDIDAITRAWKLFQPREVLAMINRPPAEWTVKQRLAVMDLLGCAYEAAYGAKIPKTLEPERPARKLAPLFTKGRTTAS